MIRFINSIDTALSSLFERIKRATAVQTVHLAYYRVFLGALLLFYFLPTWSWLKDVPPAFYNPHIFSISNLTNGHLPGYLYLAADVAAIIFSLLIVLGVYTRLAFFGMFLLSSVFYSFYYSFGKIDHHTTILIFAFLTLAFTNSGTNFAIRKDKLLPIKTQKRALAVLAIIVCFGFFSAGLPKLLKWIDFDLYTSGFLFWFYPGYFLGHNQMFLAPYVFHIPAFLLECMDYLGALFEVSGFLFLLKGKKSWLLYLIIASIFHLANLLLLNIDFTLNMLTYGVFIIAPIIYFMFQKIQSIINGRIIMFLFLLIALTKVAFVLLGESVQFLNYDSIEMLIKNWINLFLWIFAIICGFIVLRNYSFFEKI